jgi:hypothetical protein
VVDMAHCMQRQSTHSPGFGRRMPLSKQARAQYFLPWYEVLRQPATQTLRPWVAWCESHSRLLCSYTAAPKETACLSGMAAPRDDGTLPAVLLVLALHPRSLGARALESPQLTVLCAKRRRRGHPSARLCVADKGQQIGWGCGCRMQIPLHPPASLPPTICSGSL